MEAGPRNTGQDETRRETDPVRLDGSEGSVEPDGAVGALAGPDTLGLPAEPRG